MLAWSVHEESNAGWMGVHFSALSWALASTLFSMAIPEHNRGAVPRSKVRRRVKLVYCWNTNSSTRHQVEEVIKKIPLGVSKRFPERSAERVLAYCCWKCLLTDTGQDGWHAANCFDWSVAKWPVFWKSYEAFFYQSTQIYGHFINNNA